MKDINQIMMNEEFFKEYITLYHSPVVRMIRNIKRLKKADANDRKRLIKKKVQAKIGTEQIRRNVKSIMDYKPYYNVGEPIENVKIAVYGCITGGYDVVKQPVYVGNDTTYHIFTDNPCGNTGVWQEHSLDCGEYTNDANRFYKFHPFDVFNGYDFAIYTDGNVKVLSDVSTICSIAQKSKTGIAMHRHHERECAYQEALACKYYKRGNFEKIQEQLHRFRDEGFPENFGLCEATVIVYDLKNLNARKIAEQWWKEYLRSDTKRDQIPFPYVLWKNGFTINDVGDLGNDLMGNPKFLVVGHS